MTEVEWHPYPKDQPRKGRYLASVKIGQKKFVTMVDYSRDRGFRPYSFMYFHDSYVRAWAELPKPYKEKDNGF